MPINPYGRAKLVAEQIVADCARASGFGATILRYFNAAGADPDGDLGMRFDGASHLVPRLLAAAANGSGFEIYGDDYPTPDGTCVRDYIHVWDVATAHIAALDRPPAAGEARIYNLGVGRGYSVREVAASVEAVTRRPLGARIRPRRPGDAAALVAGDTGRVRAALGWQPRYGDIADIVAHGWRWFAADRRTGPPAGP